jgi:AcrR family transcriptional regulator
MTDTAAKYRNQEILPAILKAAKKLFSEQGYDNTSVRDIVKAADTSMGNLYYYFPNKLTILQTICQGYIDILRGQISQIHALSLPPEVGFALDFKIGYINTLENEKLFPLWLAIRKIPEIHKHSLENKKIRLRTFFGDRFPSEELDILAIAIQGIADSFYEQKGAGNIDESALSPSYKIIDYSLRLLGYSPQGIAVVIEQVESYIQQHQITVGEYFQN